MALPKVDIQVSSGGLGRVANTEDFVCALVLGGIAAASLAQNVAARVFSLAGAVALGITPSTHAHAHQQISNFFALAGNNAKLWIMLVPDTTTATDLFPSFLNATTGTALSIFTSNAKLLYRPSTGELKADELVAMNGVVLNNQTMNTSYTMPAGYSGMSTGPFTIAGGVTFTIPLGGRHVIL
jgi:hypothetical protein